MTETSSSRLATGSVRDVRAMYEAFPYPSPTVGGSLIEDVANSLYTLFGEDSLEGKWILDAGCGTGHRLLAVARRYPEARFVGLDMTGASIETARALARKHGLDNVQFQQGDLVEFRSTQPFDVIMSSGVIHHLENPRRGMESLAANLAENGMLVVWLYHSLGEHQRLLDREIVLTLWEREAGFDTGLQIMHALGLGLETMRYGSSASQASPDISQESIDVDAYLHPIVNAYRFDEAIGMLRSCPQISWAAINNINALQRSYLVDLGEVEQGDLGCFCLKIESLFEADVLRERFRQLSTADKLRVLELKLKPTGFTLVGGRHKSCESLNRRLQLSAIQI